jgi:XXXCH domain-containing protein
MGDKIEKEFSREEFAVYLETVAQQLRRGSVASAKREWSVPDRFSAKTHLKEKKGRIELKIQCRWSTLGDYPQKDREQITDWHASMKKVKKRMGSSFKEVKQAAENKAFPPEKAVDDFVATSRIFAEAAEPEWREAMAEYMDHLENFIRAVDQQQFEVMLHEIRDLQNRMKACHKEFK